VPKIAAVTLLCCMLAGFGYAQVPTSGNVFFGYSYLSSQVVPGNSINLNGWNGSLEGKIFPFVGIVADLDGHYGSGLSQHDFVFGPRISASVGRLRPFAHALVGVSHIGGNGSSDTSFADALGGGLDYRLARIVGLRIQVDDLQTRSFSNTQNNFRLSTGLVLRF
jgi:hypothetical protein